LYDKVLAARVHTLWLAEVVIRVDDSTLCMLRMLSSLDLYLVEVFFFKAKKLKNLTCVVTFCC